MNPWGFLCGRVPPTGGRGATPGGCPGGAGPRARAWRACVRTCRTLSKNTSAHNSAHFQDAVRILKGASLECERERGRAHLSPSFRSAHCPSHPLSVVLPQLGSVAPTATVACPSTVYWEATLTRQHQESAGPLVSPRPSYLPPPCRQPAALPCSGRPAGRPSTASL